MSNTIRDMLRDIALFIKKNFKAEKVILFGSYAYGKPTVDSDIDLFVIMETDRRFPEEGAKIRMKIEEVFDLNKPIDILVRSPEYFQKRLEMGDFFIIDINNKGIEL